MKKKMNIGTIGTSLDRNEMKKIMAGSGSCSCMYNGCMTTISQGPYSWGMVIDCGNGAHTYNGSGMWNGTACGGAC